MKRRNVQTSKRQNGGRRKRPWLRRVGVIVGCLLVGAIINVLVAWGCAIAEPAGSATSYFSKPTYVVKRDLFSVASKTGIAPHNLTCTQFHDGDWTESWSTELYWHADSTLDLEAGCIEWISVRCESRLGNMLKEKPIQEVVESIAPPGWLKSCRIPAHNIRPFAADDMGYFNVAFHTIEFQACGVPFRALIHGIVYEPRGVRGSFDCIELDKKWESRLGINSLPLRPYWPATIANSAIYATVLLLPVSVILAWRRRQRCRRGLCPDCGYDLRGADHVKCPECGEAVAAK